MMTDGFDGPALAAKAGVLLHGGRMLLLFETDDPLPAAGRVLAGGRVSSWQAAAWPSSRERGGCFGIAIIDGMPAPGAVLLVDRKERWSLLPPATVDLAPDLLVDFVRRGKLPGQAVFAFLVRHLVAGRPGDCGVALAHAAFARAFLLAAAEPDGFVEILASPEGGGLFAQGWSMSLEAGPNRMTCIAPDLNVHEVEVATFERDDVLSPARGCCLFAKDLRDGIPEELDALFFEHDGRLLRLDVVRELFVQRDPALATLHVAHMLPRLRGPASTLRAFKRVCRPRYPGTDTLSGTELPVAAAVDALFQAPDGKLLVSGWLLDPTERVEMAIVKGTGGLYAPIHRNWIRLPRPDLIQGFAGDPRFSGLLDPREVMHGFVAHVAPANPDTVEDAYLELVLEDGVLFRPLRITRIEAVDRLQPLLPSLAPEEPEFRRIVADHLAPFLDGLSARPRTGRPSSSKPIPLGQGKAEARVAAIMPIDEPSQLQPVLALLAGTPEAAGLELTLVMPRTLARDCLARVEDAFAFYGLSGQVVVTAEGRTVWERVDAGLGAVAAPEVLAWLPSALPQRPGWLAELREEAGALPEPGLISPALLYEDGSIYFAGQEPADRGSRCGRLGYGRPWLERGAPRRVTAAAPEVALVGSDLLRAAGGFAGHLFSGHFAHVDLATRLADRGSGAWCSGRVVFWKLEDAAGARDRTARILEAVDAALIARRGRTSPSEADA